MALAHSQSIPQASYGVLQRRKNATELDAVIESLQRNGYAVTSAGFDSSQIAKIAQEFDLLADAYRFDYKEKYLASRNENNTLRCPLSRSEPFRQLAMNPVVLDVLKRMIAGRFVLNQQNGIINPPRKSYNQQFWHRDLPYQHFSSSSPLAINALYCVDDFQAQNGATFVIPGSHLFAEFPSEEFLNSHATQVQAEAGDFILIDCMAFHAGGENHSQQPRRAVNHVYTMPHIRQQIDLSKALLDCDLTEDQRMLFGLDLAGCTSVAEYIDSRPIS